MEDSFIKIIRKSGRQAIENFLLSVFRNNLTLREPGLLTVGVPGGRSIVYAAAALQQLKPTELQRISLQLVDERLSGEKNSTVLLDNGIRDLMESGRFTSEQFRDLPRNPALYAQVDRFDMLFLGIGEDGHIASLFPRSYPSLDEPHTASITEIHHAPKPPPGRITITYAGFRRLAETADIYLLAFGEGKRDALNRLLSEKGETAESLPCAFFPANFEKVTLLTDLEL